MKPQDSRFEQIESIVIEWEVFKKALERNYLNEQYINQNRSYVLRLYPPFNTKMEVEYYESVDGRRYSSKLSEKPLHIHPEIVISEGDGGGFQTVPNYDTESDIRNILTEDEIEELGGIDNALEESHEVFWNDLKRNLPKTFNIGAVNGSPHSKDVDVVWKGIDN